MAAITWRDTAQANTAKDLLASSRLVNNGLDGFSTQFSEAANKMDADELSSALNQIQQLNKFGQAQQAQKDGLIQSLGLSNTDMEMKVREALANQVVSNRTANDEQNKRDDAVGLSNALNQIQELNQVGQARAAQDNGFIGNLGLRTDAMSIAARKFLQEQVESNRVNTRADETFEDATLKRKDVGTLNEINEAIANNDRKKVDEKTDSLYFDSGKAQINANKFFEEKAVTDANKDFDRKVAEGTIERNRVLQDNNNISKQLIAAMPPQLASEVSIGQDGQLQFSERVGKRHQDLINSGINQLGGYSALQSFEDMRQSAVASASPLVGADRLAGGQDQIANLSQRDTSVISDIIGKKAFDKYESVIAGLDRDNVFRANPAVPLTPITSLSDVEAAARTFLDLAKGDDLFGDASDGDYEQIANAAMRAARLATAMLPDGQRLTQEAIIGAISIAPNTMEARIDGNFGDWFDGLNPQDVADLIVAENNSMTQNYEKEASASDKAARAFAEAQYGIEARGRAQR